MISPQDNSRTIGAGSILVEKNTLLPGSLAVESGLTESGWVQFANNPDRDQLGNKLAAAGWTFFLMAGAIKTIAFGFERPRMIQAALKRLIATVRLQNCNCLEIDTIAAHSFLGMPYLSLSGHSRHIQNGLVFGNQTGTAK
jgi:hypothetical protein